MKLDRILPRLRGADHRELMRACRDIAHELLRRRWRLLRQFRAYASVIEPTDDYARGVRDALVEIAATWPWAAGDPDICPPPVDEGD